MSENFAGRREDAAPELYGSSSLKKRHRSLGLQQLRAFIKALKAVLELMAG